jgi:hypothetical protein
MVRLKGGVIHVRMCRYVGYEYYVLYVKDGKHRPFALRGVEDLFCCLDHPARTYCS